MRVWRGGASEEKDSGARGAGRGGGRSKEKEEHQRLQVEKRSASDIPTIMAQIVASIWGILQNAIGKNWGRKGLLYSTNLHRTREGGGALADSYVFLICCGSWANYLMTLLQSPCG